MRETASEDQPIAAEGRFAAPPLPARRADVSLHFLGDGGVLFDAAAQKIYAANTTAAFIWCCLEDEDPPPRIAARLRQTFGVTDREAEAAVGATLSAWRALGLLEGDLLEGARNERAMAGLATPPLVQHEGPASAPALAGVDEYRLLDLRIRLRCSPLRVRRCVAPILATLVEPAPPGAPTVDLDLQLREGRFVLAAGTQVLDECQCWDQIVPMMKGHLNLLALQHSRDFAAVHAGAVSLGTRCVLLPAESGRGKSTLTAALAAAGFPVLGDDTIVLSEDGLEARAMPFGICVKSGAWRILAGRFPSLAGRPKHQRPDGKIARYLLPRDGGTWAPPSFRQAVGWIVFPARTPTGRAELRPVPKLDAMSRLLRGFYPLGRGLDAARVDRLVAWLDGTECLELHFARLDEAVEQLGGLTC